MTTYLAMLWCSIIPLFTNFLFG